MALLSSPSLEGLGFWKSPRAGRPGRAVILDSGSAALLKVLLPRDLWLPEMETEFLLR